MKTSVIVFLLASICIQCVIPSKLNVRKKRAWVVDSLNMEEELSGPFPYKLGDLKIEKDFMKEIVPHGQGIDEDPKGILSVDNSGSVYALGKVDYEQYKTLKITLAKKNVTVAVDIVIVDVNDHAPVFNKEVYEISVDESTLQGEHLMTLLAKDHDQPSTTNSLFTMRVVSVSPSTPNVEFFIDQTEGDTFGKISFKGCLDYEEAQKYTILVEAKDHGEKVQLSSTSTVILNIIDGNNHVPEFTGMTGVMGFKEQKAGDAVCRLQVTDKDSRGSAAWRVKYSLQGEEVQHFNIQTEPETNEGVITVTKPLTYEEMLSLSLSVSVTNDEPFFSCKVKGRPTTGLWNVYFSKEESRPRTMSFPISAIGKDASDVSESAQFMKQLSVMENTETRPILEVDPLAMCLSEKTTGFTAVDPKLNSSRFHVELMGDAEGKWRIQSNHTSVTLIKDSTVRAGDHKLTLKISDSTLYSVQTLSVYVCDCRVSPSCKENREPNIQMDIKIISVISFSIFLLLGMLFFALRKTFKRKNFIQIKDEEGGSLSSDCSDSMICTKENNSRELEIMSHHYQTVKT